MKSEDDAQGAIAPIFWNTKNTLDSYYSLEIIFFAITEKMKHFLNNYR